MPRLDSYCVYCGEVGNLTRDHVIPNSYLRTHRSYDGDWLVAACGQCNSILGSELLFNVPDRAAYLVGRYEQKLRKDLECAVTLDDIDQANGHFKKYLKAALVKREIAQRRMAHLKAVASSPRWWKSERCRWMRDILDDDEAYHDLRLAILEPFRAKDHPAKPTI